MVPALETFFFCLNFELLSQCGYCVGIKNMNEAFIPIGQCSLVSLRGHPVWPPSSHGSPDCVVLCCILPEDFNKLCSVPLVIPGRPEYPPPPIGPPLQPVPPGFTPGSVIPVPRPPPEYPYLSPSREPPSKNSKASLLFFLH